MKIQSPSFPSSLLLAAMVSLNAFADPALDRFLADFERDPRAVMTRMPEKRDALSGRTLRPSPFGRRAEESRDFVRLKDEYRAKIEAKAARRESSGFMGAMGLGLSDSFLGLDPAEAVLTLEEMEAQNLKAAKIKQDAWSDHYWPHYQGILGNRYGDAGFASIFTKKFYDYYNYVMDPSRAFPGFVEGVTEATDPRLLSLSPSEKYDLLMGDKSASLTQAMWGEALGYAEENNGVVEDWMGICHGWAPAAFSELRPQKSVQVLAADGKTALTFYPADIKSLISLLWARIEVPSRYLGERCDEKSPKTDANGRIVESHCFDTEPGDWHASVVNLVGRAGQSFVMDSTYDYEVWNQPVVSYKYSYFNPVTRQSAATIDQARVKVADHPNDRFKAYRLPETVSIVGVSMDLVYLAETNPNQNATDGAANDSFTTVRYVYDLELDANGRILGGEWYSNAHPDFIWAPVRGKKPQTRNDSLVRTPWEAGTPLPADWAVNGKSAAKRGEPLAKVIRKLIQLSRTGTR